MAYSDGVTEPENDFGEFGEQRLIDLVWEHREQPLARISEIVTAAVADWIGANATRRYHPGAGAWKIESA